MKHLFLNAILLFVTASAFGERKPTVHQQLCQVSIEEYPQAFSNANQCLKNTKVEYNSGVPGISFASCDTGEWVTCEYIKSSKEVQCGSSGLDSDFCE